LLSCCGLFEKTLFETFQAKLSLEKAKQTLETQNAELSSELKQVSAGRQEAERKRKQAETLLQEVQIKLSELEKGKADTTDRTVKLQVGLGYCFGYSKSVRF
jgi:chaperonin cofactor prefoldin